MYVNAGGDPGRDDYGLPPVDIEIPDDARELARDVLAYRRELRSRRRRRLARRFSGPLTRDGMVLPLLAGCLALTLVAAALLTVFTARQPIVSPRPPRAATGSGSGAAASLAPAPDPPAAALVDTILFAAGQPTPLNSLPSPVLVLALIPPRCRCLADLQELAVQAWKARTPIYLVGVRDTPVRRFAADLGLGATQGLEDSRDSLPTPYRVAALTAVLVRTDGSAVKVFPDHGHGFEIGKYVRALRPGAAAQPGTASASPAVPTSAAPTPAAPAASGSPAASASPAG
jgi:hypothetical protein